MCCIRDQRATLLCKNLTPVHHMAPENPLGAFPHHRCRVSMLTVISPRSSTEEAVLAFTFKILSVPHILQNVYMSTSMKRFCDARGV
ncbi:hypothetical protein TNCV_3265471 [Trichonephila clavipes]|nr:hypothetical protein TNCV_3265471 [Trichonephila clavipes]